MYSTYPAVSAILLKFLVCRATCGLGRCYTGPRVDAVQYFVPIKTFEEGVSGLVAFRPVRPRWRLEGATGGLLDSSLRLRGAPRQPAHCRWMREMASGGALQRSRSLVSMCRN